MSIQKIKESELSKNGIAALSTHPTSPSLYEGRALSASELRAAFDKLPRLLAERFNALLDALELYDDGAPPETLSEAIATDFWEGHSLADLFGDIRDGNFYKYLTTDGEEKLSALIDELLQRTAIPDGYDSLLAVAEAPRGEIAVGDTRPVSGDKIARKLSEAREASRENAEGMYRLSHVGGDPLSLCLEVYKSAEGKWVTVGESLSIPQDAVVKSGSLVTCTENGVPENGFLAGDKYLDLVLAGEEESHVYVKVSDLIDTVSTVEEGDGDIVTAITHRQNTVVAQKSLRLSDLATPKDVAAVRTEIEQVRAELEQGESESVTQAVLEPILMRLEQLEAAADGNAFLYRAEDKEAYALPVPANALPYASLDTVGGKSTRKNLLDARRIGTQSQELSARWNEECGCIVLNGKIHGYSNMHPLYVPAIKGKGKTLSFSFRHVGGNVTREGEATAYLTFISGQNLYGDAAYVCDIPIPQNGEHKRVQNVTFFTSETEPSDYLDYFVIYTDAWSDSEIFTFDNYCLQVQVEEGAYATDYEPYGWHHTPVSAVGITGKNLLSPAVFDASDKMPLNGNYIFPLGNLSVGTTYTLQAAHAFATECNEKYFALQSSKDGFKTVSTHSILSQGEGVFSHTFTVAQGTEYRLLYEANAYGSVVDLQLEIGDTATAYEPYTLNRYDIPEEIQALEGYGMGIGSLKNYLDLENGTFVQTVGMRAYEDGDENDKAVITDGESTLAPLEETVVTDVKELLTQEPFLAMRKNAYIVFENPESRPVPHKITYQIKLTEGE